MKINLKEFIKCAAELTLVVFLVVFLYIITAKIFILVIDLFFDL